MWVESVLQGCVSLSGCLLHKLSGLCTTDASAACHELRSCCEEFHVGIIRVSEWIITMNYHIVSQYCHFKMERTDDNSLWKLVLGVFSDDTAPMRSDSDPTRIRLGSWGPAIGTRTAGSFDRNQWQIWLKFTPFREGLGRFLSDFWTWIAWIASTWRLKTWGQKGQHAWIILNILIHNIHDDSDWTHPELPSRWGRWSCSCTTAGTVCLLRIVFIGHREMYKMCR